MTGELARLRAMDSAGGGCMERDLAEAVGHLESRLWGEWKERSCSMRYGSATGEPWRTLWNMHPVAETVGLPQCFLRGSQVGFLGCPWSLSPGLGALQQSTGFCKWLSLPKVPVSHTSTAQATQVLQAIFPCDRKPVCES